MIGARRALAAAVAAALACLTLAGAAAAAQPSETADPHGGRYTPVMVVMDTSGSMDETVGTGKTTKIQDARDAVQAVAGSLGPDQQLGVIAYPGTSGDLGADGCESGDVVLPLADPDPGVASAAVRHLRADGDTPSSAALEHAGQILNASGAGHAVAVLVSDGGANCGPPVCATAKKLHRQGIEVTVNTVGFDLEGDPDARADLQCVADATGGEYADAGNAGALREAIVKASSSYLRITTTVPKRASVVTGTGSTLAATATVKVTNVGSRAAGLVQVALDFDTRKGNRLVTATSPVRLAGNLDPGESRSFTFALRPQPEAVGRKVGWIATASSVIGTGAQAHGSTEVVGAEAALGPLLNVDGPVAVIGDSYSSGEGGGSYVGATKDAPQTCHRSRHSYARQLYGDRAVIIACSGAVTANFDVVRQQSGSFPNKPKPVTLQRQQLEDLTRKDPPGLVMLTFGGNDIGFPTIAGHCVQKNDCDKWGQGKLDRIKDIANDLRRVYTEVDLTVNAPDVVAKRGTVAPIVVLPYVRIFPADENDLKANCFVGVELEEAKWLNELLVALNDTIAGVVDDLAQAGRPVYFPGDDVVSAFQPDHTVCAKPEQQYANAVHSNGVEVALQAPGWIAALIRAGVRRVELAHPNPKGYAAEAQALAGWSAHVKVRPVKGVPASLHPGQVNPFAGLGGSLVPYANVAGGTLQMTVNGFAPGSQVVSRLDSVPHVTGTTTADENGVAAAVVDIPARTPPGRHHVTLYGYGPNGDPRQVTTAARVLPPLTGPAELVILVGLALIAFWAATHRRRRRRR